MAPPPGAVQPHLKLRLLEFVCMSVGRVIRRKASRAIGGESTP